MRALQRGVIIWQAAIVHLHQIVFLCNLACANALYQLLLFATITQCQILFSRMDGAHIFHPILNINQVATHPSSPPSISNFLSILLAIALA